MSEDMASTPIRNFIFAFGHFDTGGLQTLVVRMASWLNAHGGESLLLVDKVDQNMHAEIEKNSLAYVETWQDDEIGKCLEDCLSSQELVGLMTFEILDYLKLERITRKLGLGNRICHLIYGLSQGAMTVGSRISGRKGRAVRALYGRIVSGCLANDQMIFMDSECQGMTREAYGLDLASFHDCIFPLPMYIEDVSARGWNGNERKTILSVSRAAFPYKGYLIGLVSEFDALVSQGDDLYLSIISFGRDIDILKKAIDGTSVDCRRRITLVEGATLDEIHQRLRSTWLYVGMGTTVLDAAGEYVPSIVAYHDTMLGKGYGFFHDDSLTIGIRYAGSGTDLSMLIEEAINLSPHDYKQVAFDTRRLFVENYSIDLVMEKMIKRFASVGRFHPSDYDLIISSLLDGARKIRRWMLGLDG